MFRPASVRHPQHRVALSLGQTDGVAADRGDTHALHRIAGADALELNAYYVAGDIWEEGHYVEQRYITLLKELR